MLNHREEKAKFEGCSPLCQGSGNPHFWNRLLATCVGLSQLDHRYMNRQMNQVTFKGASAFLRAKSLYGGTD